MRPRFVFIFLFLLSMFGASALQHATAMEVFHFTVIGQHGAEDDTSLIESLKHADAVKASFTVLNGVRPTQESCQDAVYQRRSQLIAQAITPVIVSLTAGDWSLCRNSAKRSMAQNRLGFVRELFFEKNLAQHVRHLPVVQQSSAAMFRPYSENMRWEVNGILFATMNLPSNNNHYLSAAGRNNEFEDRLIANRHWLRRIASHARSRKMKAIVLFVDANPMIAPARGKQKTPRDGYREMRRQLSLLTTQFSGRVLIVHGQRSASGIVWRRNVGMLGVGGKKGLDVTVKPGKTVQFSLVRLKPVDVAEAPRETQAEAAGRDAAGQDATGTTSDIPVKP
ncbi:MAG: hypothetical protein C4516_05110 [Oxalobacter sp.]|nr:MAG: hypothetical protein C4516_05110 [Oxalobacter sp.]